MELQSLGRNLGISDFASLTGISVATLRDWNKRGLAEGVGQPGPNGHWLYSREDAQKVQVAGWLYGEGLNWKGALFVGHIAVSHLTGRKLYPDQAYYQADHFAFFGLQAHQKHVFGVGHCHEAAVANAEMTAGPRAILSPFALAFQGAEIARLLTV